MKRRNGRICLYYIATITVIALLFIFFAAMVSEGFLVWRGIQKPVDRSNSTFLSWKVMDCKFD